MPSTELSDANAGGNGRGRSGSGLPLRQNALDPGFRGVPAARRTRGLAGLAGLGGLAGGYLLADHGGDAVAAHGDAVEGVGSLHRAALVGDDDELGTLPQLL